MWVHRKVTELPEAARRPEGLKGLRVTQASCQENSPGNHDARRFSDSSFPELEANVCPLSSEKDMLLNPTLYMSVRLFPLIQFSNNLPTPFFESLVSYLSNHKNEVYEKGAKII